MRPVFVLTLLGLLLLQPCAMADVDLDRIELPHGFAIDIYADVPNARSLALGNGGVVFVGSRKGGSVYAVVPREGGAPKVVEILKGLTAPNGVAFHKGDLYVAERKRVLRYENVQSPIDEMPEPYVLDLDLPSDRQHGRRYIGFGPDDLLYLAIGAPCNVCDRGDEGYAEIVRMNPDGSGRETYAEGIRNSVGFTWHPETGELWFTDNGRDMMGDDIPPGELNHATRQGQHFGFPYCHGGEILDPEFGKNKSCSDYTAPAQKLGPHVAPLGVKFYTGAMFPAEYQGQVFLAEHGSWNRSKKIGYRVSMVRLKDGVPVSYGVFAQGWLQGQGVTGRPVDLLVLPDGSMLVSDDHAGKIYRIYYEGE
jgi:glucose/arabinose dehydrogenase